MPTLYDVGQRVVKIRETVNEMDVRGSRNASLVVYAVQLCNELVQLLNDTAHDMKKEGDRADEQPDTDQPEPH